MKPSPIRSPKFFATRALAGTLVAAALHAAAFADDSDAAPAMVEATAPQPRITPADAVPVAVDSDALKQAYLGCEDRAARERLDFGSAAHCSLVYEALLRGVFRGRYEELYAWWKDTVPMP